MGPKKPEPKRRTTEEIMAEYGRVCAELGDLVYRRDVGIPVAIEELLTRARRLNIEAAGAAKESENHG